MPVAVAIPDPALLDSAAFAGMIDPARTALLVIDIQRDFCAPGGFCELAGADLSTMEAAIDRVRAIIPAARRAGLAVVFLRVITQDDTDPPALLRLMARRGRPGGAALCRAGTAGAGYYRVAPLPGDIEIEKIHFDGFLETDLDRRLQARGIDTLIVTGVSTDCCVDSTARAAFQRNYDVFVVTDACAASSPHLHHGALAALEQNVALLVACETVTEALAKLSQSVAFEGRVTSATDRSPAASRS
jgi:nicotinamidase-related amidase